ncbi:SH3 domain-containing protein [Parablastomonas sp. CN1-191]|uniref:SH3 domain-containing protein n=1 Tax=Parablastomonas sp. CN1-191 TaxID=3400908 RepID=UPI003BF8C605
MMLLRRLALDLAIVLGAAGAAAPVLAADDVPFWASIRASKINMRVGPGEEYKISWVYSRPGLPLKVERVVDSWWLVSDPDGEKGWVLLRFLDKNRHTAIVVGKGLAEMRAQGSADARVRWKLEPGVSGKLGDCKDGWCAFTVDAQSGYVRQERLWGAGDP